VGAAAARKTNEKQLADEEANSAARVARQDRESTPATLLRGIGGKSAISVGEKMKPHERSCKEETVGEGGDAVRRQVQMEERRRRREGHKETGPGVERAPLLGKKRLVANKIGDNAPAPKAKEAGTPP